MSQFKKVEVDKKPDTLLHIQNGYKIAACTWVIDAVLLNIAEYTGHLNSRERAKVTKEVDKLVDGIRNKRARYADNG